MELNFLLSNQPVTIAGNGVGAEIDATTALSVAAVFVDLEEL
jgi:hypothetical protein